MIQEIKSPLATTQLHKRIVKLMGNRFEITVVDNNQVFAEKCIEAAIDEIRRIEALLTTFKDTSQVNAINQAAGIHKVKVDRELVDLIHRSKKISALTQGAFDITYGSVDKKLWNFDQSMTALPDKETARQLVRLINYNNVIVDPDNATVFLQEKGMRIGFGGIGKGYAAEKAKMIMKSMGVKGGIVNASGDLTVWGHQPNGRPWTIGIANPNAAKSAFSYLELSDMSVATSGNYEKFILIDGKKYSHTIDPKTGLPVTGIKSVTIICPNAEIADAMATPVMIMGIKAGLDMINQVKGIACIIVDDNDKIYTSQNIRLR